MAETLFVKSSVISLPPQVRPFNINNIAFFSTDPFIQGVNPFEACNDLKTVGEFFGTNSETYKIATVMFAQEIDFTAGDGSLFIIPFAGVNAVAAKVKTGDLSGKILAFKAVSDGKIAFVVDGTLYDLTGLNFSQIVTLDDILTIFQSKINAGILNLALEDNGTTLAFSSLKFGFSSSLVIQASTSIGGTDLLDITLLDESSFVDTAGVNASGETLKAACERILALPTGERPPFESVITNLRFELDYAQDSTLQTLGAYFAAIDKIFAYAYCGANDTVNALLVKQANLTKIRLLYHKISEVLLYAPAAVSRLFVNKSAIPAFSLTLNKKQLAGLTPTLYLTTGQIQALDNAGVDCYLSNVGTPAYVSSTNNGGAFDDIYNLKFIDLEVVQDADNALGTPTKRPQTQGTVDFLAGVLRTTLIRLRNNGVIPLNGNVKWSGDTVPSGTSLENFQRKISTEGFYIETPNIALQPQADREQRNAPVILYYVKLAGAIHKMQLIGFVER
jgi:hypothetical protein